MLSFSASLAAPARGYAEATIELWQAGMTIAPEGITLTTSLCEEWRTFAQSDDFFLAVRVPVSPTVSITESQPLPLISGGTYSNTMQLVGPSVRVITTPLELRPERLTFLANELPAAPGETWMAMGPVSDTTTYPAGLELPPNRWALQTRFYLDLTHQPNNCVGCTLPLYYCYEGQDPPSPFFTDLYRALDRHITPYQGSYQGLGITCLGPHPLHLLDWAIPLWELGEASLAMITPTQVISFPHYLGNWTDQPMTVTLAYTVPLPVAWGLYEDAGGTTPITPPIPLPMYRGKEFWLISEPVPTTTVDGPYTLIITATDVTSPTNSRWTSDLIWVGDWVAPPLPPSGTATPTPTPLATATATPTAIPTATPTSAGTATPTPTPTFTATPTPTSTPAPVPIGGVIVPVNRLALLAPWLGLAALLAVAVAAVVIRMRMV
ncbi:MAG: hypothetical protein FJZ89_03115 [Chloroflexi bacterium]|nr:hypothetical protein [Chloroflexota bacterium]